MVKMIEFEKKNQQSLTYLLNQTNVETQRRSRRLGMASMGDPCLRKMWFRFRWARISPLNRRVKRIFSLGNACEKIVINELESVGVIITERQTPVPGWGGHIFGFTDGVATNVPGAPKTPHLLEIKSMNDRIFKTVKKHGVEKAKPEHYIQMQNYMGKLKFKRGLYCAINKNDSEIHPERIYFDQNKYKEAMSRGVDVVSHEIAPPNLFQDEGSQACKWCEFIPICYQSADVLKSCRTCTRVDIEEDGKWSCNLLKKELTFEEQEAGCKHYSPLRVI